MTSESASDQGIYRTTETRRAEAGGNVAALSITLFAAVFMFVAGGFHVLQGLAALINDEFFVLADGYAYDVDITAWGWAHVVVGGFVALTGLAVLTGSLWARIVAIFIVVVSAIVNFVFIPYQPLWAIVLLVVDGVVIWALMMTLDPDEASDFS